MPMYTSISQNQNMPSPACLQRPADNRPRIKEDRLDIEQDEQHAHQIELHLKRVRASPTGSMPHS